MAPSHQVHEVAGFGRVEDAETLREAESLCVCRNVAVSHGVERPTSWSLRACQSGQGRRPGQHLICCPSRESQQKDALRRCPALEQAGDSCG